MQKKYFSASNSNLKDKIKLIDYPLFFLILLLGIISFFSMYSSEGGAFNYYTQNHIYRFCIFFILFILLSFLNIQFWHKSSYLFYFIVLLLLISVHIFGVTASGSKRWINILFFNIQPSELMKTFLLVVLARYYSTIPSQDVSNIKKMIIPLFAIFIPVFFIIKQPDLGTAMLVAFGGFALIWLAGFRLKYLVITSILSICLLPVAVSFLKTYQKSRILTFLNPERDPLGAGYQIIQSKIAVGSGGIFGKGYLLGSQSYLDYLPEKHTDFIFTLFSEEFGFFGSLSLLVIYALIIQRIISIGNKGKSHFAKLYCYGFAMSFFIYVAVNMSMVLGLLPIVGAPLPIMSYGGSSMLSIMIGLSIVMSSKIYSQNT
jgi:rod shape determining protein RodA